MRTTRVLIAVKVEHTDAISGEAVNQAVLTSVSNTGCNQLIDDVYDMLTEQFPNEAELDQITVEIDAAK